MCSRGWRRRDDRHAADSADRALTARKQWMADHLQTARPASCSTMAPSQSSPKDGKILLPIGVIDVNGDFGRGEVIACVSAQGREVARGITNYSSSEARRSMRRPSGESNPCSATCWSRN